MNIYIFVIYVVVLIIDQLSKFMVDSVLLSNKIIVIPNILEIFSVHNFGAAWGILSGHLNILIIFSLIGLLLIFRYIKLFKSNLRNNISFGLILGGITGNLIDRLFLEYVRDFISVKIINYNFPVFNVADMMIVIGVILLIISIIKGDDKDENNSK